MRSVFSSRLDVNIAGPLVGGFDQDFVHQLDDRGFLGHLGHFAVVGLDVLEQLDIFLGPVLHQGGDRLAADAEVGLDEPLDFARAGQHRMDVQTRQRLQFVERINVVGIARWPPSACRCCGTAASATCGGPACIGMAFMVSGSTFTLVRSTSSMPNSSAKVASTCSSRAKPRSMSSSWADLLGEAAWTSAKRDAVFFAEIALLDEFVDKLHAGLGGASCSGSGVPSLMMKDEA